MPTRPDVVLLPPRPQHRPDIGDPIAVPYDGGMQSPLVEQYVAYLGEGRFTVLTEGHHRHIVKWDEKTGWVAMMSWCKCR